jgi:hypothetical protein
VSSSSSPVQTDPFKNPSYPARTHFSDAAQLSETLSSWQERIDAAITKLLNMPPSGERTTLERLYHQALGARDQFADAARRIPREAGALYQEDRERLKAAEAALDRLAKQWEAAGL